LAVNPTPLTQEEEILSFDEITHVEPENINDKQKTTNIDIRVAKEANIFFKKKMRAENRDCILVRVDLNRGLKFEKHNG
jgi:hypothetical protein